MERITCQTILTGILLLACFGGCIWITFGQVTKFFARVTFMGSFLVLQEPEFPEFIFCNASGFTDVPESYKVDELTPENYSKLALPIDVKFEFIYSYEYESSASLKYKVLNQSTKFNGNCLVYQIEGTMKAKTYYTFTYPKDQTVLATINDKDGYLYAIGLEWTELPPNTIVIKGDKQIEMELIKYNLVPKGGKEFKACSPSVHHQDFIECFRTQLRTYFEAQNFTCKPHLFTNFLNKINLPACEENGDGKMTSRKLYDFYRNNMLTYSKREVNAICDLPCVTNVYQTGMIHLKYMEQTNFSGRNRILFALSSRLVGESNETYMYDFTSIVSSVGGGVGIFLGFSCFGIFSSALNSLFQLL